MSDFTKTNTVAPAKLKDGLRARIVSNGIGATRSYTRPLTIVTTLIFIWGFLTCLNDILVPHLKSMVDLSYARVMLVQFAFFSVYFRFFPAVVEDRKYHRLPENRGGRIADHGGVGVAADTFAGMSERAGLRLARQDSTR